MKAFRRSITSSSPSSSPPTSSWIHLRSLVVVASPSAAPDRGTLKSPWFRRRRKYVLSRHQWNSFFTTDGKLHDGGVKFLKKVRSGGVDPSIRAEVWPFLLGVYDLNSSEEERNATEAQKRKEYKKLRRQCRQLLKRTNICEKELSVIAEISDTDSPRFDNSPKYDGSPKSPGFEDVFSADHFATRDQRGSDEDNLKYRDSEASAATLFDMEEEDMSMIIQEHASETEFSDSDSSVGDETISMPYTETDCELDKIASIEGENCTTNSKKEDIAVWQRIIRLDAIRANAEWATYSHAQAGISKDKAYQSAVAVGLKDYGHLEPYGIYHAARLVAVLEAYALYDPEIGYCQGMSDLLSPILAVMEEDHEAFWCFVGFMRKARNNFRLDEVGIRRQLDIVSRIIKSKGINLYRHLEKLQAEDCFFVYRMVVVLFRRELTFEQTTCLWEVMWADQAAIRAGVGKSATGRIRLRAPPTDDLLLYAIAACVLQKRKLIIERYNSMDEIMRECNSMAGQLDVWKLLDDAHALIVTLHDKI